MYAWAGPNSSEWNKLLKMWHNISQVLWAFDILPALDKNGKETIPGILLNFRWLQIASTVTLKQPSLDSANDRLSIPDLSNVTVA